MELVRSTFRALKSKLGALREMSPKGVLDILRDGNLMEAKIHAQGSKLVGVDKFGNKYYEKLNAQFGRHRWVHYAEKKSYDASTVPPEWHGWLHYITDHTPEQLEELKPLRYGIEHKPNLSGLGSKFAYHSKGHALNPQQRAWTRYEPWETAKESESLPRTTASS